MAGGPSSDARCDTQAPSHHRALAPSTLIPPRCPASAQLSHACRVCVCACSVGGGVCAGRSAGGAGAYTREHVVRVEARRRRTARAEQQQGRQAARARAGGRSRAWWPEPRARGGACVVAGAVVAGAWRPKPGGRSRWWPEPGGRGLVAGGEPSWRGATPYAASMARAQWRAARRERRRRRGRWPRRRGCSVRCRRVRRRRRRRRGCDE